MIQNPMAKLQEAVGKTIGTKNIVACGSIASNSRETSYYTTAIAK
jgi:hypothetical protein